MIEPIMDDWWYDVHFDSLRGILDVVDVGQSPMDKEHVIDYH